MPLTEVRSELGAVVWKVRAAVGQQVEQDEVLMILECMKMEVSVCAPSAGTVERIHVAEGVSVAEEQVLVTLSP